MVLLNFSENRNDNQKKITLNDIPSTSKLLSEKALFEYRCRGRLVDMFEKKKKKQHIKVKPKLYKQIQ